MGTTISIPEGLYERLHEIANGQGSTPDALVERIITGVLATSPPDGAGAANDATTPTDWGAVERELSATEPHFPTVEDAMSHLRGRAWRKAN